MKHKKILIQRFQTLIAKKPLIVLDIEDNYPFGDPELIEILKIELSEYL